MIALLVAAALTTADFPKLRALSARANTFLLRVAERQSAIPVTEETVLSQLCRDEVRFRVADTGTLLSGLLPVLTMRFVVRNPQDGAEAAKILAVWTQATRDQLQLNRQELSRHMPACSKFPDVLRDAEGVQDIWDESEALLSAEPRD